MRIPFSFPKHLVDFIQALIRDKKHTISEIEAMIERYQSFKPKVKGLVVQGDNLDEWWEPSQVQQEVIDYFLFEVISTYESMSHRSFYSEETHGPYFSNGKEYNITLDHTYPTFKLQLKGGRKREVRIFLLPSHSGARF
jgi:hypothetical protein